MTPHPFSQALARELARDLRLCRLNGRRQEICHGGAGPFLGAVEKDGEQNLGKAMAKSRKPWKSQGNHPFLRNILGRSQENMGKLYAEV